VAILKSWVTPDRFLIDKGLVIIIYRLVLRFGEFFIDAIPLINLHKFRDSNMKVPFQSNNG